MAKKIPTALLRNPDDRAKVLLEVNPGCEWVFAGEGVPTRKWNGTCVMVDEYGNWWARREVKPGKGEPDGYIVVDYDEVTGKTQGWEPAEQSSFKKFLDEALGHIPEAVWTPGTYELVGPKIQGNTEQLDRHMLLKHENAPIIPDLTGVRGIDHITRVIRDLGSHLYWEGVVWHHPDGRMAKLKARDL